MFGMLRFALGIVVALATLVFAPFSHADTGVEKRPLSLAEVPPELRDWVPWVLWDQGERECVLGSDQERSCVWPGFLELEVGAKQGRFVLYVRTDALAPVTLPGADGVWPEAVKLDGKDVVVLAEGGEPTTWLTPGNHRIEGEFSWNEMPETLAIGARTGVVALTVEGKRVLAPRREGDGRLWLGASAASEGAATDSLSMEVFRRIDDGVPLRITTRLVLRASGRAREAPLGNVLLPKTVPLALTSELPARLETSGELVVQLRAGTHTVEVQARAEGAPERILLQPRPEPWPATEIWVWAPSSELREVAIVGAREIDPARTGLDESWKKLAAFELRANDALSFSTLRRGNAEPPPNQINLVRDLWLDFDGHGYTVKDVLSGSVKREHRLELRAQLPGTIRVDGNPELVTSLVPAGPGGVELRNSILNLEAEFRLPRAVKLPANGWSEDVQSLSASLHLPPGWLFFGASGVDSAPSSWLSSWDLFAIFYLLLVTLAALKLGGRGLALLGFTTLVAAHGEGDAPFWIWAALLVVVALRKATVPPFLRPLLIAVSLVVAGAWVVLAVPFAATHLRAAVHPLLVNGGNSSEGASSWSTLGGAREKRAPVPQSVAPLEQADEKEVAADAAPEPPKGQADNVSSRWASKSKAGYSYQNLAQDPKAVVQTGPGVPHWSWNTESLIWNGPVAREHQFSLWLLPPWCVRLLEVLRVLGVVGFGLLLAKLAWWRSRSTGNTEQRPSTPPPESPSQVLIASILIGAMVTVVGYSTHANAESSKSPAAEVTDERLSELARRLTLSPACTNCLSVSRAEVKITGSTLTIVLDVHAGAATRLRLPGPVVAWVPENVALGSDAHAPVALEGGVLVARIPAGRQQVVMKGPLLVNDLALELADKPQRVVVTAPGWDVSGVGRDGRLEGAVTFTRRDRGTSGAAGSEAGTPSLPPWLTLTREVELGVSWVVRSRLVRETSTDLPVLVRVPLLLGERVTVADVPVEGGSVLASLPRGQTELVWTSTLEPRDRLLLSAAVGTNYAEVWSLDCGFVWHCKATGLAPVRHDLEQRWRPLWRPFAGEKIEIAVSRPLPVPGTSKTIEGATLTITPGERLTRSSLTFQVRSSSGGTQRVTLPKGAVLQELTVAGEARASRLEGGAVAIGLSPGLSEVRLAWQEPQGISTFWQASEVVLEGGAANVVVIAEPNQERWLLALAGPDFGPSVLFWGYLAVVCLAAFVLGHLPGSRLRRLEWLGLALGLTQIPAPLAVLVPAWFFAFAWFEGVGLRARWWRRLTILGLVITTVVMLGTLGTAVYSGLVVVPDMQVEGAGSTAARLVWYTDRSPASLPTPMVVGTSIWVWRGLMLVWSLWLASRLLGWLRWGWLVLLTPPLPEPLPEPVPPSVPEVPEEAL